MKIEKAFDINEKVNEVNHESKSLAENVLNSILKGENFISESLTNKNKKQEKALGVMSQFTHLLALEHNNQYN